jgi:OmcA/MtrC family decaheme c-type cytochrome
MKRFFSLQKFLTICFFGLALALAGCEGDDGRDGRPGPQGEQGPPGEPATPGEPTDPASATLTASESCTVCHGPSSSLLPMNQFHDADVINPGNVLNALAATITSVTFPVAPAAITPTVTFSVTLNGAPFTGLAATATSRGRMAFGIAKLIPGPPDVWQSYINRAAIPDGDPVPVLPGPVAQATTASGNTGGTLVETATPGTYTFTFNQDLATAITVGTTLVGYDPALTHRVGIQFTPSAPIPAGAFHNTFLDVRPDGLLITVTRNIATTASCLECHTRSVIAPRWGFHGSSARQEVEFCVICHNPGSIDPESGNTVNLAVMVHKIHRGRSLPSVAAGGSYVIIGNQDSLHDYSHVGYPQDIRNCEKCHTAADAATPDGDNWMNRPNRAACGSCHDDVSFDAPIPAGQRAHTGGLGLPDSGCTLCHPGTGPINPASSSFPVATVHAIPGRAEAANFAFNIISVTNTAPGQQPVVTFEVTNPNAANARINILTDPTFTQTASGASRLAIIIGWKTGTVGLGDPVIDWTNKGSGNNVGQPVSINPLAAGVATANPDGSFTVTSPVAIPLQAEGTGIAALEGHPASADGTRLPVRSAFLYFGVTDAVPEPRREVVTAAGQPLKCNNCHDQLSVHGANRTDSIEVCVICHNPNATDIGRRPFTTDPNAVGIDGKREETIDFKNMIHAIHASGEGGGDPRTIPLVIYGFGGAPIDFAEVTFPGNMRKCTTCHEQNPNRVVQLLNPTGETWTLPLEVGILATTVNSPPDLADPDDDGNITKTAGVCSACHDAAVFRAHMQAQGASFNVRQGNIIE